MHKTIATTAVVVALASAALAFVAGAVLPGILAVLAAALTGYATLTGGRR